MDIYDTLLCKISFTDTIEQLPSNVDLMEAYSDGKLTWREFRDLRDELSIAWSAHAQGGK